MNGREALRALADGKRVRRAAWTRREAFVEHVIGIGLVWHDGDRFTHPVMGDDWELVPDQPATDEELIEAILDLRDRAGSPEVFEAYQNCFEMLRERKVKP